MENNIIKLVDYANQKGSIKTLNEYDVQHFSLENDEISIRRVYSFMVDMAAIMTINASIHTSFAIFVKEFYSPVSKDLSHQLLLGNTGLNVGVFMLVYMTYFFYSMYVNDGKTFGKMIFKIRTVTSQYINDEEVFNKELSPMQAFRRSFGYLTLFLSCGTFFIFNLLSEDKRGLMDYFSESRTVSDEWIQGMDAYKQYEHDEVRININSLPKAS